MKKIIFFLLILLLPIKGYSQYKYSDSKSITIPIIVHVVYQTDEQNIPDSIIQSQIEVLNEDFNAKNPDINNVPEPFKSHIGISNIYFKLIDVRRIETYQCGFIFFPSIFQDVKFTITGGDNVINPESTLNIWVCNLINVLGYAQFPDLYSITDGVVINYQLFGKNNSSHPYNLGRTTTHEVGHWLGLKHLWGNGGILNFAQTDGCDDTPPQFEPTYFCKDFPQYDSLTPNYPGIMFNNFMDYGYDNCVWFFTKDQVKLMWNTIFFSRPELLNNKL